MRAAAEQGNADAQASLGSCYLEGKGVAQDHEKAAYWYRKAAEQGDPEGQAGLGLCYYLGYGVPEDSDQAAYWFELVAAQAQGNDSALMQLDKIKAEAEALKQQDAKQARAVAQKENATPSYSGNQRKQLEAAAEQGDAEAQFEICYTIARKLLTLEGARERAIYWCHRAANQGHKGAMSLLGDFYRQGWGVPKDIEKAAYWSQKSRE